MGDDRLARGDWVKAGLKALARDGASALKADRLARELGVSRGSFYWHFADVEAFHRAVLEGWKAVAYEDIVARLAQIEGDRLGALVSGALQSDTKLEKAVRAWAAHDAAARAMVKAVDARRIGYMEQELVALGQTRRTAGARARVIYWTWLGSFLAGEAAPGQALDDVARELLRLAQMDGKEGRR